MHSWGLINNYVTSFDGFLEALAFCSACCLEFLLVHGAWRKGRWIHRALSSACASQLTRLGGPICNTRTRGGHGGDLRGHAPVHEAHCSDSEDSDDDAHATNSDASSVRSRSGSSRCSSRIGGWREGHTRGGVGRCAVNASAKGLRVAAARRRH